MIARLARRSARDLLRPSTAARHLNTQAPVSFWVVPGSVPSLNAEQATACFETISTYLEFSRASEMLKEIRLSQSSQSLALRWQRMFDIYLTTQLHVIHPFGYAADQSGIQAFTMNVAQVQQSLGQGAGLGKELLEAQKENWELLIERAFGVSMADGATEAITLETCRGIAKSVATHVMSPAFEAQVSERVDGIADPQAKQQALMELVVDAHFEILPEHGLEGEEGYVRAQAKMMNFTGDQEIMTSMHGAMTYLQSKAGV
jgi:hypothetical protein